VQILWVKPGKLLPLDTGGKLRTYNILRHLSATHDLTYLSYHGGNRDLEYERQLQAQLPGAVTFPTGAQDNSNPRRLLDYARRVTWRAPYAVSRFTDRGVRQLVGQMLREDRFDVAVCDFLAATLNFPDPLTTPTVLFQHNVESALWRRKAELEPRWLDRMVAKFEYAKMRRFEPAQVRRFHHIIAVSEQDRQAMASMVDGSRISVVPTGVDLATFVYDPEARPAEPRVVFTGSMDWKPNIDGVEYFCREIWPLVLAEVPRARFQIVGRDPHPRVRQLASASVEITGTVPSIVDYLRQASVVVIPLRIGGGTRIKIYEGMAMGKATVSTSIGAEGLDVHDGHDIILADEAGAFAAGIIRLLQQESTRRQFEAAAAATAGRYDWSVISEGFAGVLQHTIRETRR
jgi:glycosyltransferase involved in cell wall biosynthesis